MPPKLWLLKTRGVEKLTKADVYKDMTVEVYSTGSDMNVLVITAM